MLLIATASVVVTALAAIYTMLPVIMQVMLSSSCYRPHTVL